MPNGSHRLRPLARPALLLLIFAAAFFHFWDSAIVSKDSLIFFAPNKRLILRALADFTIYEWNPWQFLGLPFTADPQPGCFYPLNLIFLLFDFGIAHRLFILLHYPIAAGAMYLFLRGRGLREEPAWFGGLVFALSGYLISQHAPVRMLLGAAWAPLCFYFMGQALAGRLCRAAAAGAVLALQVLAGDPETAFVTAAATGAWALADAAGKRRFRAPASALALAGASALAFAAVQILPAWQMMALSERSGGLALDGALPFSIHPAVFAELAWPTPFGLSWPRFFYWGGFSIDAPGMRDPWSASNYLGLPALFLAGLAVWSRPRRRGLLAAGLLLSALLALGRHTPVYGWAHALVPVFDSFRYPAKFMAWVTLALAVLAAGGLAEAMRLAVDAPRALLRAGFAWLAAIVVLAAVGAVVWPLALAHFSPFPAGSDRAAAAVLHLKLGGLQALVVNLACAGVVLLMARGRLSPRAGAGLIISAVGLDLWLTNVRIMPAGPADIYEPGGRAARVIAADAGGGLGHFRVFREDFPFPDRDYAQEPYLSVRQVLWARDTLNRNLGALDDLEDLVGYGSYELRAGWQLFGQPLGARELALFNVRYVISPAERKPAELGPAELLYLDPAGNFSVHRLRDSLPRAYWVPAARTAGNEGRALDLLNKIDPRREVVITTSGALPPAAKGELTPARVLDYQPDRVRLEIDAPADGWLVLSDRDYPGWSARVDGRPAPIFTANVMVRAVPVSVGSHQVEFVFRQPGLRPGAAVSGLAWLAGIAFWIVDWRRRPAAGAAG